MRRQIIKINQEKCNGCGACAKACAEGAIVMKNNKAVLVRDDYCDGLGNCLPVCKVQAISFEEREAMPFNEEMVLQQQKQHLDCGCSSTQSKVFKRKYLEGEVKAHKSESELRQFPIQIKLVSPNADYFHGADLLVAADCTAFGYGSFHEDFIRKRITIIGCPKLDNIDYSEKLTDILTMNKINSITIVKMEVPCCQGIVSAVKTAIKNSGVLIPLNIITISTSGAVI